MYPRDAMSGSIAKGNFLNLFHLLQSTRRIHNRCLWEKYLLEKKWLNEKNHGTMNELELFHGCKSTAPVYQWDLMFDIVKLEGGALLHTSLQLLNMLIDMHVCMCMDGTKEIFFANVLLNW